MKNSKSKTVLQVMLLLIVFCFGGSLIIIPFNEGSIFIIVYIIILLLLFKIISSSKEIIFIKQNVSRFKYIGICFSILTILEYLFSLSHQHQGTRLFDLAPGIFINLNMGIYIIVALLSFVISDSFKSAISIKEDNDLTI